MTGTSPIPTIARNWRRRTTRAKAEEYASYLYEAGIRPLEEKGWRCSSCARTGPGDRVRYHLLQGERGGHVALRRGGPEAHPPPPGACSDAGLIVLSRAHAAVLAKQGVRAKDAAMSMLAQRRVTVDEFLVWAEGQEGRWELHNGVPYRMPPERTGHVEVKYAAYMALMQAIRMAGVPCHVLGDGVGVRVSQYVMYVPDALVYCGPKLPRDALEVPNPVIHPGRGGVTIDAQV